VIRDFDRAEGPGELECELCIVGSGPVGLAIALEFEGSPLRVVVLESGGDAHEDSAEALSLFENAGHRRVHPSAVRRRIFGGTSSVWSGRCVPFSPLDLQPRDWIPHSGWPLDTDGLQGCLQRAGRLLQAGPAVYDDRVWAMLGAHAPRAPWDPATFETQVFQASTVRHPRTRQIPAPHDPDSGSLGALNHSSVPQAEDIGELARARLQASRNVTVLLHAHALEVQTDAEGGRAEAVRIGSPAGRVGRVRARHVVLACGAIDNARLLLLSRSRHAEGLGNACDRVGRYLMDHHYAVVATLQGTQGRRLRRRIGYRWLDVNGQRHVVVTGISLSPQRQREERLPRATLFTFEHVVRPAAISAARRGDWSVALLHPWGLASDVADRYLHRLPPLSPVSRIDIGCNVEQFPDPDSRVTLGESVDAFGQPRARIHWRLDEREYHGYRRAAELFAAECSRLGLEQPRLSAWVREPESGWRAALHDMAHPMGTTRMADDPRHGVVDRHCRVHGVAGLHVAGSSVFTTGGTSNPTLMAVALGLRLADRLRASFERGEDVGHSQPRIEALGSPRVRVGLVGAGPRMRDIHVPVLAALHSRFEVVGVTSRGQASREALASANGWRAFDSIPALVGQARPEMLLVAVHGEATAPVLFHAMGFGLPLLSETPLCWNERVGHALVGLARSRGIALGVAEQFPFTPPEQLKRRLIALGAIGAVTSAANDFASYDYHGLAQLRAYAGYAVEPDAVRARRERRVPMVGQPGAAPAQIPPQDCLLASIRMTGGVQLVHNYSAGYAMLPSRPRGELRVTGQAGSLVDERVSFADPAAGRILSVTFERTARSIGVTHPSLGRIEWEDPFAATALTDEQRAVALHVDAFDRVVRDGGVPLYGAEQALQDIELLRALHYSAERGGAEVRLPLRTRLEQARVAVNRVGRRLRVLR
jgi:choline dehydrogenase-like flavoprotein/predicted dehydrogenase